MSKTLFESLDEYSTEDLVHVAKDLQLLARQNQDASSGVGRLLGVFETVVKNQVRIRGIKAERDRRLADAVTASATRIGVEELAHGDVIQIGGRVGIVEYIGSLCTEAGDWKTIEARTRYNDKIKTRTRPWGKVKRVNV